MNDPIDLTQFEPSWRGYPPVPSRMSDGGFTSEKYRPAEIHDVETGTPPVVGFEDAPRSVAGGGGGVYSCTSLRLFSKLVSGTTELWHTAGQIGEELFEEASLGSLAGAAGKFFVATFTLVGDTATPTIGLLASLPSPTASLKYVLLGSVGDDESISLGACGANVSVCRNWFASSAPYYSMNVLTI